MLIQSIHYTFANDDAGRTGELFKELRCFSLREPEWPTVLVRRVPAKTRRAKTVRPL